MWILGIQKQSNGSICLLKDGEIVLFLQEERISRKKKFSFPFKSIQKIKQYTSKIDVVIFSGYSYKKQENELFYRMLLEDNLVDLNTGWKEYQQSHHLFHASNAFYNSGFDEALCVVWDGQGSEFETISGNKGSETTTVFHAKYPAEFNPVFKNIHMNNIQADYSSEHHIDNHILNTPINYETQFRYDLDIGCMYQAVTQHLGFDLEDCGKTMGLSAYGEKDPSIPELILQTDKIYSNSNLFVNRFRLNTDLYPNLNPANLAFSLQSSIEVMGLNLIQRMLKQTSLKKLVISGGVGLNVCLNSKIRKHIPNDVEIYIEPNCEDTGNSIGACKYYWHSVTDDLTKRPLKTCYLGESPSYDYSLLLGETEEETDYSKICNLLESGNIVALFQGQSEIGPRALGNRSLLFDPRVSNGKDIVNSVKHREWFRPFAASILVEEFSNYFDTLGLTESPFMMYAVTAKDGVKEKVPSVIHFDNTCRIQTVKETDNQHYYNLIKEFYTRTAVPMLFNTSFNLAGEPMVETVQDALDTMRKSKIEYLYLPEKNKLITVKNI